MNPLNIVIYIKKNRSFSFMCRMSMCIMGCESIVILLTNIEICVVCGFVIRYHHLKEFLL